MKCNTAEFLYKTIPFNRFRSYLITTHLLRCKSCSAGLADENKIGEIMARPENALKKTDLWPDLRENILAYEREKKKKAKKTPAAVRKWQLGLTGAVVLLIIILIPFIFNRGTGQDRDTSGSEHQKIVLKTLMIENRPAKSYFFQSKDTDKTIVWVQKTKS